MKVFGSTMVILYFVIAVASARTELFAPPTSDGTLPMSQFFVCVIPLMLAASAVVIADFRTKKRTRGSFGLNEKVRVAFWTIGVAATFVQVIAWRG